MYLNSLIKSVKKISFLTGAGVSTSAGIPDFRSNTGLFKTLQEKYNLNSPEEFFHIETFRKNPEYFYEWAKEFDLNKYEPTITHVMSNFTFSGL
jgi:NAD-dependent histone deacetylase SIR2